MILTRMATLQKVVITICYGEVMVMVIIFFSAKDRRDYDQGNIENYVINSIYFWLIKYFYGKNDF